MATFYYDAECGFCTWATVQLRRLAPHLDVDPGEKPLIERTAYYRDDEGVTHVRNKAIGTALRRHGRNSLVRALGALLQFPIFDPIYRLIASQRHRLGPALGAPACSTRK